MLAFINVFFLMPSIFPTVVTSVFNVCDELTPLFYKPKISAQSSNID